MAEHVLTESADNSRLSVRVGDRIVIRLPENSGAGYAWEADSLDDDRLELTARTYEADATIGGEGVGVLTFAAKATGRTRLELRKVRPWESPRRSTGRFSIAVTIGS